MNEVIPKYDLVKTIDGIKIYCISEDEVPAINISEIKQKLFNIDLNALETTSNNLIEPIYNDLDIIFKTILNNKELLHIIGFAQPIEALFVGGSRMLNIAKTDSDFDINVVVSQNALNTILQSINKISVPLIYFEYNSQKIHWYYSSDKQLIEGIEYYEYMKDFWIIEATYGLIHPKNQLIINNNEKFMNFYNMIIQKANSTLENIRQKYFGNLMELIKLDLNCFAKEIYTEIYHLCIISCLLNNWKLNKEYLIELKKYAKLNTKLFLGVTVNYNKQIILWCHQCLNKLVEYFMNN